MTDVHTEHCCIVHGCKYMDPACTVVRGIKKQSFACEDCEEESEDFAYSWRELQKLVAKVQKDTAERCMLIISEQTPTQAAPHFHDLAWVFVKAIKKEFRV